MAGEPECKRRPWDLDHHYSGLCYEQDLLPVYQDGVLTVTPGPAISPNGLEWSSMVSLYQRRALKRVRWVFKLTETNEYGDESIYRYGDECPGEGWKMDDDYTLLLKMEEEQTHGDAVQKGGTKAGETEARADGAEREREDVLCPAAGF
jgi:hypothetical protein